MPERENEFDPENEVPEPEISLPDFDKDLLITSLEDTHQNPNIGTDWANSLHEKRPGNFKTILDLASIYSEGNKETEQAIFSSLLVYSRLIEKRLDAKKMKDDFEK